MNIRILGTESLGVRGLSCSVQLENQKIFLDPGIALGWSRYGLHPHPFQVAVGARVRDAIIDELKDSSDIVFSHFHGDHCPLLHPNPYQLGISEVETLLRNSRLWGKDVSTGSPVQRTRKDELTRMVKTDLLPAEGRTVGPLSFSMAVPHGRETQKTNTVMMTKITEGGVSFVHASDIQLLERQTIDRILEWHPDIVLVSGPPLYHFTSPSMQSLKEQAWSQAVRLAEQIDTLIIDHHLLRCKEGITWLNRLKERVKSKVVRAAEFMNREALFLEAWREDLYEWLPVEENWHTEYQAGRVKAEDYYIRGWEILKRRGRIKGNPLSED